MESLSASRSSARKHGFWVVVELMASSMLCSGEDLDRIRT